MRIGRRISMSRFFFVDMPASIVSVSSDGTMSSCSVYYLSVVVKFLWLSHFGGSLTSPVVYCTFRPCRFSRMSAAYTRPVPMMPVEFR